MELLIKTYKAKENFSDNLGHNFSRLFDDFQNFPFTTNEVNRNY